MIERANGFALIYVIWVLAVLTVLTLGLGDRALLEARASAYAMDQARAKYMARAAVERGVTALEERTIATILASGRRRSSGAGMVPTFTGAHDLVEEALLTNIEAGDTCQYLITDAENRFSLNTTPEAVFDEMDWLGFSTVNAIMRRRADEVRGRPAHPFLAVEEVMLLDDVVADDWLGDDDQPGLRDLLTVWGDGLVNVNSATEEVLRLLPDLTPDVVATLMAYRRGNDGLEGTPDDRTFGNLAEIPGAIGISADQLQPIFAYCKVESEFFTIVGFASVAGGRVRAQCAATVHIVDGKAGVVAWMEDDFES